MELSIVIPAYNEEETIINVIRDVHHVMKNSGISYELIIVNDGSTDNTTALVKKEDATLISHPYNKGYGASLKTGAINANGEFVLYFDADGQHDANDILKLLNFRGNFDMVVGERKKRTSLIRTPAKKILSVLANYLAERKIPDLNSGFRLIRRKIILEFIHILPNSFSFTTTITLACIKEGYDIKYVPINIRQRKKGKSTISPIKDSLRFIMLLLRVTMLFSPMRVFLPISFVLFLSGFSLLLYEIICYFNVGTLSVLLMLSSMLIFFFGLLADQMSFIRRT